MPSSSRVARSRAPSTVTTRVGGSPCRAASSVGASGVEPTAWNSATAPDEAAAAPIAFRRSSCVPGGRPTMTGISSPVSLPTTSPSTGYSTSLASSAGESPDVDHDLAAPVLEAVQARVGHPPGNRAGDVGEVAVALRPRTEHAVAEDDRVRLGPGHLLAESRPGKGELVRRAGVGRPAADGHVRLHLAAGGVGGRGVELGQLGVQQVDQPDVQRRRHPHLAAQLREPLAEVQPRAAVVHAGIDVCAGDLEQSRRPHRACNAGHHAHREGGRRPLLPGQHRLLGVRQLHRGRSYRLQDFAVMGLRGQVAWITGSSSGNGRAIAERYARERRGGALLGHPPRPRSRAASTSGRRRTS